MQYLGAISKNNRMFSVPFQGKIFKINVIQVYAPTTNAKEAEVEQFYENLQDLLELTQKKDVLFIIGDWNAEVCSQEIPGVTGTFGFGVHSGNRTKANRVLSRECTCKHPLPATKEMTLHIGITRWSILTTDSLYSSQPKMEKLYRVSKDKNRN